MAYCEWAGVRLPTEEEYLAAMILDDRIFPRGIRTPPGSRKSSSSRPGRLRGTWLNFTSTTAPDGRVVCRYGPLMLRYQGVPLTDPRSRIIVAPDAFTGGRRDPRLQAQARGEMTRDGERFREDASLLGYRSSRIVSQPIR